MVIPTIYWIKSLFTSLDIPIVTLSAVNITPYSMDLIGDLIFMPNGLTEVKIYFNYRKVGDSTWTSTPPGTYSDPATGVSTTISNLDPNSEYEYYAIITDTSDVYIDEGQILSSTTQPIAEITLLDATNILAYEADLNVDITAIHGSGLNGYFVYNSLQTVSIPISIVNLYTVFADQLTPQTTYTYKFVLIDEFGNTIETPEKTFVTKDLINYTLSSTPFYRTANLNANISDIYGANSTAKFSYFNNGFWINTPDFSITETGDYFKTISGLIAANSYDWKFIYTDGQYTYESSIQTLTTLDPNLPTIENIRIISRTTYDITIRFDIINDGGADITESGFVYNFGGTPTVLDYKQVEDNQITMTLFELDTYYIRGFTKNSVGVTYTDEITAKIEDSPELVEKRKTPGIDVYFYNEFNLDD